LVDAILLGDLLFEVGEGGPVGAAALGRGQLLLQLHAADILLALGQGPARQRQSNQGKRCQTADRPHRRRTNAPKLATDSHNGSDPRESP
jgi:hypothetical protein